MQAAEQNRLDVAERRAWWQVQQAGLDPERLVFIDETWAKTNMTRPRGRSLRGTRLVDKAPHGHWKTTTFVAALRASGLTAPLVLDGAINGDVFLAYVKQVLVPTLRLGDIVIMDNLSSHKRVGVRAAIESVGAKLLYLPPYSPDFNPIELAFSKLNWPSPSSSGYFEPPLSEPSKRFGKPAAHSSTTSTNTNAETTFDTAATAILMLDAL
jgi:transposase